LLYVLGVTRHEAQQWCLAHAFELVELNPQELPDEDGEIAEIPMISFTVTFEFLTIFFILTHYCCFLL